ncbi:ovomucoid-like [Elgaria multicarinata webbii]|uniref:ovomucoid-like n=1 Tax=Elgaria multicarinata webbii TaxID=159646 RepID=UPI002FCD490E
MKVACFLLLTLALFFLYSDVAVNAQHIHHRCEPGYPRQCNNRPGTPHCGTDGRTYPNHCSYCNAEARNPRLRVRCLRDCRRCPRKDE